MQKLKLLSNFVIIEIMKKDKTTIEDLAGMVQRGFESVDKRFESVDKRFESVDKRFDLLTDNVNSRFDRVESRLDAIEMELIDIKKKLENVIDRREFETLKERVKNLENRLAMALGKKK